MTIVMTVHTPENEIEMVHNFFRVQYSQILLIFSCQVQSMVANSGSHCMNCDQRGRTQVEFYFCNQRLESESYQMRQGGITSIAKIFSKPY